MDTTTKYTRKYDQVLQRRNEMSEQFIQDQVAHFNRLMYETYVFRASSAAVLEASNIWGASLSIAPGVVDVSLPQLMTRKKAHDKELLGYKLSEEQKWKPEEIIGRVSGDALWKRQRGEDGKGADTI